MIFIFKALTIDQHIQKLKLLPSFKLYSEHISSHSAEDMFFLNEAESDLGVITSKHKALKREGKEKEQPFLIALSL
jgi:hypothetical protein